MFLNQTASFSHHALFLVVLFDLCMRVGLTLYNIIFHAGVRTSLLNQNNVSIFVIYIPRELCDVINNYAQFSIDRFNCFQFTGVQSPVFSAGTVNGPHHIGLLYRATMKYARHLQFVASWIQCRRSVIHSL